MAYLAIVIYFYTPITYVIHMNTSFKYACTLNKVHSNSDQANNIGRSIQNYGRFKCL